MAAVARLSGAAALLSVMSVTAALSGEPYIIACSEIDGSIQIDDQHFATVAELRAKLAKLASQIPKPKISTGCEAVVVDDGMTPADWAGLRKARQLLESVGLKPDTQNQDIP